MAENQGNTAVPTQQGDRDRVAMLSLRVDGTPDQHNPEIIGDEEYALEATKRQFVEQAVSALDAQQRAASAGSAEEVKQDPSIKKAKAEQDKVAKEAEKAAEAAVKALKA